MQRLFIILRIVLTILFVMFVFTCSAQIRFQKTFSGGNDPDEFTALEMTSDSTLIVAGHTGNGSQGGRDHLIMEIDEYGQVLGAATFGDTAAEYTNSVLRGPDNSIVVGGQTRSNTAGKSDFRVFSFNADATFTLNWDVIIGETGVESGGELIRAHDGGFIGTGYSGSFGNGEQYVYKVDTSGNLLWTKTLGGSAVDSGYSITATSDTGYVLTGMNRSHAISGSDIGLLKLDQNGNVLWSKQYDSTFYETGRIVRETAEGDIIVAGTATNTNSNSKKDIVILKTDSSGNLLWSYVYGGQESDIPFGLTKLPLGYFAVTGGTESGGFGKEDGFLLLINQSGDFLGARLYGGVEQDRLYDYQLPPDQTGGILIGFSKSFNSNHKKEAWLIKSEGNTSGCNELAGFSKWEISFSTSAGINTSAGGQVHSGGTFAPITGTDSMLCGNCTNADFTPASPAIYLGDSITFDNQSSCADSVRWFLNDQLISTSETLPIGFTYTGSYNLELVAIDTIYNNTDTTSKTYVIEQMRPNPLFQDSSAHSLAGRAQDDSTGADTLKPMKVYDRFGNEYDLEELRVNSHIEQAGMFTLHYEVDTSTGFDDPANAPYPNECQNLYNGTNCDSIGQQRRNVLRQVFVDLSQLIEQHAPPHLNPGQQNVQIRVQQRDLSGGALAEGTPYFLDYTNGLIRGNVWQMINTGFDPYYNLANSPNLQGGFYHGRLRVDFGHNYSLHLDTLGVPGNEHDLYSILLHEAMHILGFAPLIDEDGTSRLNNTSPGQYNFFDTFLQSGNSPGTPLLDNTDSCYSPQYASGQPNLTPGCNSIFFSGGNGQANDYQEVYSPSTWAGGSSLSHFECFSSGCPSNNYVMKACANTGAFRRNLHTAEVATLCDLGYSLTGTYGDGAYNPSWSDTTYTLNCTPDSLAGVNDFGPYSANNAPGTANGPAEYCVEAGDSITIAYSELDANDVNDNPDPSDAISCLETSIPASGTQLTANADSFSFTPPSWFSGDAVLKYRPQDNSGDRGHPTYVVICVESPPLPPCDTSSASCELVCHGDFEGVQNQNAGPLGALWMHDNLQSSIDLYNDNINLIPGTISAYNICDNSGGSFNAPTPVNPPNPNNNYVAVSAWVNSEEGVVFELIDQLDENCQYEVTFDHLNGCSLDLNFVFSEERPCNSPGNGVFNGNNIVTTNCGGYTYDPTFTETETNIVSTTDQGEPQWTNHTFTFIPPAGSQDQVLTIYPSTINAFILLDNISIRPICETQVTVHTNSPSSPCSGDSTQIDYEVCLDDSSTTNTDTIVLDLEPLPSDLTNPGGDFAGGQATILPNVLDSNNICETRILPLEVDSSATPGLSLNVRMNVEIDSTACVDNIPPDSTITEEVVPGISDILTLSKSASPNNGLNPGDSATYTLELCNISLSQAVENIALADTLPSKVNFGAASAGLAYDAGSHSINFAQPVDLGVDTCTSFTYTVAIDSFSDCALSQFHNCAHITYAEGACELPTSCETLSLEGRWPIHIYSDENDDRFRNVNDVTTDTNGNVYVVGTFAHKAIFEDGDTTDSPNNFHLYAAKYDSCGNFLWSAVSDSMEDINYDMHSIAVDDSGNAFITGHFSGDTITFNGLNPMVFGSSNQIYLFKFSSSGTPLWGEQFGPSGAISEATDIEIGPYTDSLFICGNSDQVVNFNGVSDKGIFVVSLDQNNGAGNWITRLYNKALPDYYSSIDLDPGNAIYYNVRDSIGEVNPANGNIVHSQYVNYISDVYTNISFDGNDRIYTSTDQILESFDVTLTPYSSQWLISGINPEINSMDADTTGCYYNNQELVVKRDKNNNGNVLWADSSQFSNTVGGPYHFGLTLDQSKDHVYFSGTYIDSIQFNQTVYNSVDPNGTSNGYVARLSTGSGVFAKKGGRDHADNEQDDRVFQRGKSNVSFYPNPSHGTIHIERQADSLQAETIRISIYNVMGSRVQSFQRMWNDQESSLTIDLESSMKNGIYFLRYRSGNNSGVHKMILMK